jgi:hypothetical protein
VSVATLTADRVAATNLVQLAETLPNEFQRELQARQALAVLDAREPWTDVSTSVLGQYDSSASLRRRASNVLVSLGGAQANTGGTRGGFVTGSVGASAPAPPAPSTLKNQIASLVPSEVLTASADFTKAVGELIKSLGKGVNEVSGAVDVLGEGAKDAAGTTATITKATPYVLAGVAVVVALFVGWKVLR